MTSVRLPDRPPIDRGVEWLALAIGVLLLGATLRPILPRLTAPPGGPAVSYVVTATPIDGADGAPRVDALLIDGATAMLDRDAMATGWRLDSTVKASLTPSLVLDGKATRHQLAYRARHFALLVWPGGWRGTLDVTRDGAPLSRVVVRDPWQRLVIDETSATPAWWRWLALILGLAITLLMRPWRGNGQRLAWLLVVLTVVHLAFWAGQPVGIGEDSTGYLDSVSELGIGRPAYFPPGYPLLLLLAGGRGNPALGGTVTLLQHAMVIAIGAWTYALLRRRAGAGPSLLAGLAIGAMPSLLGMSQAVMSEVPTAFLMTGTAYFATEAKDRDRATPALLAGACAGLAVLTRVVPAVALGPALLLWFLFPADERRVRLAAWSAASGTAVLVAALAWFTLRSGQPRLANSVGLHLYNRVVFTQHLFDSTGAASRELLTDIGGADPRPLAFWDLRADPAFERLGYTHIEALLGRVAKEGIRTAPFAFVAATPGMAWDEIRATPFGEIPEWTDVRAAASGPMATAPPLATTAASLRLRWRLERLQERWWPVLLVLAGLGTLVGLCTRHRHGALALAWIVVGYLLATASLDMVLLRHAIGVTPFLVALAVLPLAAIARATAPSHASARGRTEVGA